PSASMVGLDAGVAKLATLSEGTVFEPVNSFQKNQKTLARLQRQLSRKVKFSNNWKKQKRKKQRPVNYTHLSLLLFFCVLISIDVV
ncbi:transposase, partial [Corynebacterium diphtheriae]|uniref:transposase n=1 Tax=Corynebacterium diphtheriae TaxID=1717 RepID=UPI001C63292F